MDSNAAHWGVYNDLLACMNIFWRINPRLLAVHDRLLARRLVPIAVRQIREIFAKYDRQPNSITETEIFLLAAWLTTDAHKRARGSGDNAPVERFWPDFCSSLFLHIARFEQATVPHDRTNQTLGDFTRELLPIIEKRFTGYSEAIEKDAKIIATRKFAVNQQLPRQIAETLFNVSCDVATNDEGAIAFDIFMRVAPLWLRAVELFRHPSLGGMALDLITPRDAFWVTYRPPRLE